MGPLRLALPLLVLAAGPWLPAAPDTATMASIEASFAPVRAQFLDRVIGHTIDTAEARECLGEWGIVPDDFLPPTLTIARVVNPNHRIDEEQTRVLNFHTATLRFRAELEGGGGEEEIRPDLYFTVIFVLVDGRWVKTGSVALWDVERFLPPNDLNYAARPFNREIGERLNDLPPWP